MLTKLRVFKPRISRIGSHTNIPPVKSKLVIAFKLFGGGVLTATGLAIAYDLRDQERFKSAQRAFQVDQEHLKESISEQIKSEEELLDYVEQLAIGDIPNPQEGAY